MTTSPLTFLTRLSKGEMELVVEESTDYDEFIDELIETNLVRVYKPFYKITKRGKELVKSGLGYQEFLDREERDRFLSNQTPYIIQPKQTSEHNAQPIKNLESNTKSGFFIRHWESILKAIIGTVIGGLILDYIIKHLK